MMARRGGLACIYRGCVFLRRKLSAGRGAKGEKVKLGVGEKKEKRQRKRTNGAVFHGICSYRPIVITDETLD